MVVTDRYRDIWKKLYQYPHLARVLEKQLDLKTQPITREEQLFVTELIFHLDTVFQAMSQGLLKRPEGIHIDIQEFFSLPIPKTVWENSKHFRGKKFEKFVEGSMEK